MSNVCSRSRLAGLSGVVAIAIALAVPAIAGAALITIGALGSTAKVSYKHPVDTAFWLTAGAGGAPAAASRSGLVRLIRLRGCARPGPAGQTPLTQVHFQALRPGRGGTATVALTTGPLNVPVCGRGASGATVSAYPMKHLCVARGDYVAFNVEGGFGPGFPSGVRYEMFAHAAGASTESFTLANGTNNGDTLRGVAHPGVQLLMQFVVGTGRQAGGCH